MRTRKKRTIFFGMADDSRPDTPGESSRSIKSLMKQNVVVEGDIGLERVDPVQWPLTESPTSPIQHAAAKG